MRSEVPSLNLITQKHHFHCSRFMKPTADEIRKVAESEIPNLEIQNMPQENELHVPITKNGYFYLVVFCRNTAEGKTDEWIFDSIIER